MTEKAIIFDASTLISFAMNGLLDKIVKLKESFNGKFLITKEVEYEIVKRPIKIKRFELEALKLDQLIKDKILEFPDSFGENDKEISEKTQQLLDLANKTFQKKDKDLHLIDLGETSCLVLSKMLTEKNIPNLLAIDERTTRMLCEKPENLKKLLQKKNKATITYKKENLKYFQGFKIIRSTELGYIAYKKGLIKLKGNLVLDALLYALKFKGCSISGDEIEEIKRMK